MTASEDRKMVILKPVDGGFKILGRQADKHESVTVTDAAGTVIMRGSGIDPNGRMVKLAPADDAATDDLIHAGDEFTVTFTLKTEPITSYRRIAPSAVLSDKISKQQWEDASSIVKARYAPMKTSETVSEDFIGALDVPDDLFHAQPVKARLGEAIWSVISADGYSMIGHRLLASGRFWPKISLLADPYDGKSKMVRPRDRRRRPTMSEPVYGRKIWSIPPNDPAWPTIYGHDEDDLLDTVRKIIDRIERLGLTVDHASTARSE
jgi:hypothetical protein